MGFDGFVSSKTTSKLLALDAVKANIMVADANLNITYSLGPKTGSHFSDLSCRFGFL